MDVFEFEFEAGDLLGFSNSENDTVQVMTLEKSDTGAIVPANTTLLLTQSNKLSSEYHIGHPMITDDDVHGALTIH